MEKLTARSNDKIKFAAGIRDSAKERKETGFFFLEGARLCSDASENGIEIKRAFFTENALEKYSSYAFSVQKNAAEAYIITEEISKKLSDTQNPQGIFCICKADKSADSTDKISVGGKYILLENVQDPSNLGAISRTAEALGIDGMIVCGGCDIYNPKALRASMGSAMRLNIISCDNAPALLRELGNRGMLTLASTPDSTCTPVNAVNTDCGTVIAIGNEGNGVTKETMDSCKLKITIPMGGRAESLNASTAAAILIWEMVRP